MRAFALLLALLAAPALAQYPSKPIRVVVPFGAGSSTDIVMRILAQPLGQSLGQPVVVENKPGADGAIAAAEVARAPADGHTLVLGTNSPFSAVPHLRKNAPYDALADFTPVTLVGNYTFFVVVHPSVPARTLRELITYARANPGKLNYGTGNTSSIVLTAMFVRLTNIDLVHVPYKSEPPAITDLLSGTINLAIDTLPQNVPFIKDGKLRAIAVTSPARAPMAPDVPSVQELGQRKLVAENFLGISGPAGLPREVVARINAANKKALADPKVAQRLAELGVQSRDMTPEQFTAFVAAQVKDWYQPVKDSGAKLN
jgi:tripartite-type tricarboxylate transporter receptor subunit TctC